MSPTPSQPSGPVQVPGPRRRSNFWRWMLGIFLGLSLIAAVGIRIVIARAQPILRTRVIDTLSARFKSRVELPELHVWISDGLHVEGKGLQVYGLTDPNPSQAGVQPLFEIAEFRFQTALGNLFREPMRVDTIYVDGLVMNIPPKGEREQMGTMGHRPGKMKIAVDHFVCVNTKLVINTNKPGKEPLEFDIKNLRMRDIGPDQPMHFDATLVNPKPVGDIQSSGQFGPFNLESPRDSAVSGNYSFTNADLGTLKGIGGILSSTGQYKGQLGRIEVEGHTDTPDFRLNISGHRVPLHTEFHAIVDGTDGDTYLEPVKATVLHSSFTAQGKIVRVQNPRGHDIELDVVLDKANIEDLLMLGVKTDPPIMTGAVMMKAKLSLPPGDPDVATRIKLAGSFRIPQGHFTNDKVQGRIDSFSLRSQGKAKLAQEHPEENVASDLRGTFTLGEGVLTFSSLRFAIPGTNANIDGTYSLDGNTFDFHGILRLDAKLSKMTTGWKSILLKPVDPFFSKHGAGVEVPFKVTGTKDEPHFGLDFHHKDESPNQPAPRNPAH
jgi:AsmA-like C-terminal region